MSDTKIMVATFGVVVAFMGLLYWAWSMKIGF